MADSTRWAPGSSLTLVFLPKSMMCAQLQELFCLRNLSHFKSKKTWVVVLTNSSSPADCKICLMWIKKSLSQLGSGSPFWKTWDFVSTLFSLGVPISFTRGVRRAAGITATQPTCCHYHTSCSNQYPLPFCSILQAKVALYTFEDFVPITSTNWHPKVKLGKQWYSDLVFWCDYIRVKGQYSRRFVSGIWKQA